MAHTAFLFVNSGFGNVGQAAPNAQVYADMVVKDEHDQVVSSQQAGCSTPLSYTDNHATIAARLTQAAREVTGDPAMNVVLL